MDQGLPRVVCYHRIVSAVCLDAVSRKPALRLQSSKMLPARQLSLRDSGATRSTVDATSSTFVPNMRLPVHRWFRFSAGFSADWVESVVSCARADGPVRVLDPFAGSGTTLIAAEGAGAESVGIEAHPFVARVARAKLASRTDPERFRCLAQRVRSRAVECEGSVEGYPDLIRRCFPETTLASLDALRRALDAESDGSSASELVWLALASILRTVSPAGTAQWQYILPNKHKRAVPNPLPAFESACGAFYADMLARRLDGSPYAALIEGDARTCAGLDSGYATLVLTSPPYPNNYDYADATRLEMSFFREIRGWGDLREAVRRFLVRSCSQHVPERSIDLAETMSAPELEPIREELVQICSALAQIRKTRGGKKTYHLMIAAYFRDLALSWRALRRVTAHPCRVCFVIGDSAPYGVYVPVIPWMGRLALAAGFRSFRFEKTRDRNIKWKNRKHRVPLQEGRLWVEG
jgi:DNA methylase